ncbi:hypothetical protein H0H93_009137, partial [Arthromyces matolae]
MPQTNQFPLEESRPMTDGTKRAAEDPTGASPPGKERQQHETKMVVMPGGEKIKAGNEALLAYMQSQMSMGLPDFVRISDLEEPSQWPEPRRPDGRACESDCWHYEKFERIRAQRKSESNVASINLEDGGADKRKASS